MMTVRGIVIHSSVYEYITIQDDSFLRTRVDLIEYDKYKDTIEYLQLAISELLILMFG